MSTLGGTFGTLANIPEGKYTTTIYSLIQESRFGDVIRLLKSDVSKSSRASLSLLGYCYYQIQDFASASDVYEKLSRSYPEVVDYRLYYAQALYKSSQYQSAQKIAHSIHGNEYASRILKLQTAIKFESGDLTGAKMLIDSMSPQDPETMINQACFLYKEGKYKDACQKYQDAFKLQGYSSDIHYYIALCYYKMKQYVLSLKFLSDIIEKGIRDHPELNVGMLTEGLDMSSVGNSMVLHSTYLIEAFNLKSAIEFNLKNYESAREALTDMPPRTEEELDPITLHNQAITNIDQDATGGFEKLTFLLSQTPCPPETFGNLLVLYIKYEYYDIAADLLAESGPLFSQSVSPYLFEFLEACIIKQTSPESGFQKLDEIVNRHLDMLRKLTKKVQEARQNQDDLIVRNAVEEYDLNVDRVIPALMAQAKILWDAGNYITIEKLFRKSVEFCNENDIWKLNVGHVLFMQESKYKEAISFYEPFVKKNYDNILNVTAIVLANLCVSYIMTSQNEQAEELMRKIEKEEEIVSIEDPNKRVYHLCIVNLVIGTLYCAKGNYEFGITRIIKSLDPFNKKLGTDTWYYSKRCFVSLYETLSKHMISIKDQIYQDILEFFDNCELYGKDIPVSADPLSSNDHLTVSYEARLLKALYLKLMDD